MPNRLFSRLSTVVDLTPKDRVKGRKFLPCSHVSLHAHAQYMHMYMSCDMCIIPPKRLSLYSDSCRSDCVRVS